MVSATRSGPPTDSELKELLRARGERPKLAEAPKVVVLAACAFDGSDRHLVGDLRDHVLYSVPLFGQLFTGLERSEAITIPEKGELRFVYFVKSPTELNARIRVNRNGGVFVRVWAGSQSASGSGRLGGNSGRGSWRGVGSSGTCSGYWTAERR